MADLSNYILSGIASALPAAGIAGRLYCATDTLLIYRDDGTAWHIATNAAGGGGGGGSNHFLYDLSVGVPALSSLTQVNISGTASAVENAGVSLTIANTTPPINTASTVNLLAQDIPGATPYRVAMFVLTDYQSINFTGLAFGWRDSSGKLDVVCIDNGNTLEAQHWSSPTTRVGNTTLPGGLPFATAGQWLGLRDDGAGNIIWEISQTGAYWTTIQTVAKSSGYLGGSGYANQIVAGLFADDNVFTPTRQIAISFLCWDATAITGRKVGCVG